jgi:hypothetical protein
MKQRLHFFLISIILTTVLSCKKEKAPAPVSGSGITPSNANSFYATLILAKFMSGSGSTLFSYTSTSAIFFSSPSATNNPSLQIPVDSVFSNGTKLSYNTTSKEYDDTTLSIVYPPVTWKVNGSTPIPNFTYTDAHPLPNYTGYHSLPDSISHNSSLTVSLSGISNVTNIMVYISDDTGNNVSRYLPSAATSAAFTSSEMMTLHPTSNAYISILCLKSSPMNVYGKPMLFAGELIYIKYITIN